MAPGLPVPLSANRRLDVAESGVAANQGQRRRRGEAGRGIAHRRYHTCSVNNQLLKATAGAKPGAAAALGAPILHPSSFDMWCAGCDYRGDPPPPAAAWSVKYE